MKNYKKQRCWQATTRTSLRKGTVIDQKVDEIGWLLVYVKWQNNSFSWERVVNLSFDLTQIGE
jgi:hypothetical protein